MTIQNIRVGIKVEGLFYPKFVLTGIVIKMSDGDVTVKTRVGILKTFEGFCRVVKD